MYHKISSSIDQISLKKYGTMEETLIFWLLSSSFPFFTERLIVGEEFYANNLKTAMKSGKIFK